jgi:hypothetical protein
MKIPENETSMWLGWALVDLDDPAPRLARRVAEHLGLSIEEFIDIALREKLERMDEIPGIEGVPDPDERVRVVDGTAEGTAAGLPGPAA